MNKNNFQRANTIIDEWPSWKKEYKLTTHSSQDGSQEKSKHKEKKCNTPHTVK